jgi:hypothetical protein
MTDKYENWVKKPVEDKTLELENFVSQQVQTYGTKAKQTAYKPVDYYQGRPTFHRGLFWIGCGLLLVL